MAPGRETQELSCSFSLLHAQDGYRVRFRGGDQPAIECPFAFDLSPTARVRGVIARIEQGVCTRPDLQDVGSQLWSALRPPGIVEALAALEQQADESRPLRVWLDVPPEAELERLPWEALHDELASSFLGTDLRYCLLRAPPPGCPPILSPRVEPRPLRVLVAIPRGSGLQVQYEWNNLRGMAQGLRGALELGLVEGRVTPDRLQEELHSATWDVLHYIGHGEVGEEGISIRLNREGGESDELWMDASTFASLVQGQHLRLVLLNCCLGASPSVSRTLSGLGPHLMRTARVPAVIAMRYEVSDPISIRFADSFYRELLTSASGHVDIAVQEARRSLRINSSGDTIRGFATPVLYLSPGCEQLFDVRPVSPQAPVSASKARPSLELPEVLVSSLLERRLIPVVGTGLHQPLQLMRRRSLESATLAPSLAQLIHQLAQESHYPEEQELLWMEKLGEWYRVLLLARVCQHYQRDGRRYRLIESLQAFCARADPPTLLQQLATWDVPGIFYLHFDGLMEEALKRANKRPRVINRVELSQPGEYAEPLLINLLGTLTHSASLRLTELDRDQLAERMSSASTEVVDLVHQMGRSFLFLGAPSRDPVVRRLSCLLETGGASMQGPCFFVSTEATEVDACYWSAFNVHWIHEEPAAVIEALTARRQAEGEF